MTDHDPDKQLMCRVYCAGMALGLTIFFTGVYIGTLIASCP